MVAVGTGEGIGVGWEVAAKGIAVEVGRGWFDGEQAVMTVKSMSSVAICFLA
jgi:hypothetical protein